MKPTGGQLNVAGILYQMLVSLTEALNATVTAVAGTNGSTVEIQPEPFDGGDVQIGGLRRLVVQIKRRNASLRWSVSDIVRGVLPDLIKAVRPGHDDRYQFVTDNDDGCDEFRAFLAWFRECPPAGESASVPDRLFRLGRGRPVPADQLLAALPTALKMEAGDPRLSQLLGSLEIVRRTEHDLIRDIQKPLTILVERVQDVPAKVSQLLGDLLILGAPGSKVSTAEFLRSAQLDPRRLVHASRLAGTLREELGAVFPDFRYDPATDVRTPLAPPTRSVTVLRGESGLGKTWRLCATAKAMAEAGRPVILLRASADVDRLRERIATLVWNPIYSEALPLRSIADRLRPVLGDERNVWLTVFLDDLNDPELARAIVEDGWSRLGIDLVISSQPPTAHWLSGSAAAAEMVDVPEFTLPELIDYLGDRDVDFASMAPDVLDLLVKPILASLFAGLPQNLVFRPETEYELMQSFWENPSSDRPSQLQHAFDLDRLELLVGDMLAEPPIYPWPPASFIRTFDLDAAQRLAIRGLIEIDGQRRIAITHDRLLNWAMARHLADRARDRNLTSQELLQLLQRAQELTTLGGVRIGARFGYVLMDLLWLLLAPGRWPVEQVAGFLLARTRDPQFDAYDRTFFSQSLPTLGARGVPLMRAMIEQPLAGDYETHWPGWLADGMRKAADGAWEEVRAAATTLFTSGIDIQREAALTICAKVDAPDLLDDFHRLNLVRVRAFEQGAPDDRMTLLQAKERSFNALARAIAASPAWLDAHIAATSASDEAEQLLWALLKQRRSVALPIWLARRYHLHSVIRATARVLAQAVRAFAEPVDVPLLRLPPPEGADMLFGAVTFDAIARLDPSHALDLLRNEPEDSALDLRATEHWWMPGLQFRRRGRLGEALRQRARELGSPNGADQLARLYGGFPELMEDDTVDLLLDGLHAKLTTDEPPEDRLRKSWRLLLTLSSARTAATLATIAARRGQPLEDALASIGAARPASSSRTVDREGEMIARLLAIMAGTGFDRLVLAQLASSGRTTREYGLRYAFWTTSDTVGAALDRMALDPAESDDDRPYYLMQALAAHGRDQGLARLIAGNSPVYTDAVHIRHAQTGDTSALIADIRRTVVSGTSAERIQAVDLSHFLRGEYAIELTAPLIALARPGDELATRLLMLHYYHGHYEPALLPKLLPFLEAQGGSGATAAAHLAHYGDRDARAASLRWLTVYGLAESYPQIALAAIELLEHDDSREGAKSFLRELNSRWSGFGRLNADVLAALARHGDAVAAQQLLGLAYGSGTNDLSTVAGAIRIAARENSPGAYQAARRLFAQSGQQEAARLVMEADPSEGLQALLTGYVGAASDKRLSIARTLRWGASMEELVRVLGDMSRAADETMREIAAEIAGWIPDDVTLPWLRALAGDAVRSVEESALAAFHRRASSIAAKELMAVIPQLPRPAQWACLRALIDLVDPHLLSQPGDPLDIRTVLRGLPEQFALEADRLLERQRQDVDKKATQAARR